MGKIENKAGDRAEIDAIVSRALTGDQSSYAALYSRFAAGLVSALL